MEEPTSVQHRYQIPFDDRAETARRAEALAADLAWRHRRGVSHLLAHRADLRGVHAFADLLEESVRWSA